jgi:diguanylate cyclase (GGDEF)-like protein
MVVVRHGHRDLGLLRVAIARGRCSTEIRQRLEALAALAGVAWAALRDPALGVGRGARLGGRDEATGLPDGRAFEQMLSSALEAARRVRGKLAVVLIRPVRIDSIRADDGSIFADAAIGLAARAARATVRASDPVARLEDDTLALLLPGASESNARRVAEAVRSAIAEAGQTASTPTPLTAVVGLAAFPGPATTAAALIAEARRVLSQSEVEPRPSEVPA